MVWESPPVGWHNSLMEQEFLTYSRVSRHYAWFSKYLSALEFVRRSSSFYYQHESLRWVCSAIEKYHLRASFNLLV